VLAGWVIGYFVGIAVFLLIQPLRRQHRREQEERTHSVLPTNVV